VLRRVERGGQPDDRGVGLSQGAVLAVGDVHEDLIVTAGRG
jgi:hypothetical protein